MHARILNFKTANVDAVELQQRRTEQARAYEETRQGRILSPRLIEARVTGVTRYGLFVRLAGVGAEGLLDPGWSPLQLGVESAVAEQGILVPGPGCHRAGALASRDRPRRT